MWGPVRAPVFCRPIPPTAIELIAGDLTCAAGWEPPFFINIRDMGTRLPNVSARA